MSPNVGEELPAFTIDRVSSEAMKEWAVFLHDPNPIHLDPEVVKSKGLGDKVINQGPANVAYMMNMLMAAFPGATISKMQSRFLDNVYAGDHLIAGGKVTARDDEQAQCEVWLRANDCTTVLTGTATLRFVP
ncbi:MAG: hypothetical protein KGO02_06535 [Alphaproteobacteria bacterium]|nr:hypothetical protein [Alphaproteobacteria bacterium]